MIVRDGDDEDAHQLLLDFLIQQEQHSTVLGAHVDQVGCPRAENEQF